MSQSKEADEGNSSEFKWGKQLSANINIGEIKYFESFVYNGVEYFLYDCAYFYNKDDEDRPYIGKIVKIWDHPKCPKRVKIVWFILPNEIRNYLEDVVLKEKEIFLSCGKGSGLSNDSKLETVVAKCNVVCTSKDKRNPQPSEEELMVTDYIFYRTFDVGNFTFSDKLGDKIAEINVQHFLNKGEPQRVRPDSIGPELKRTKVVSGLDQRGKTPFSQGEDKAKLNSLKTSQHLGSLKNSTLGESAKHKPKEVPRDSSSLRVEKESNASENSLKSEPSVSSPLSWEEKIADARQKGTLVLFQNLDPSYTSKEIEDLVWSNFEEKCNAGMVQQTAYSSPHNGKAFVVFDTIGSAYTVLTKLHSGGLMLRNRRPLVAEVGFPARPGKQPKFVGHLSIEKLDNQKQREKKKNAVSTSHFPWSNTIEFEMAMEWILLRKRSEQQLEALYECHGKQLADLKAQLK